MNLFDVRKIPFSRRGAEMSIAWMPENHRELCGPAGLYLRHMSGDASNPVSNYPRSAIGRIVPLVDGKEVAYQIEEQAGGLILTAETGKLLLAFSRQGVLTIEGAGLDLRLEVQSGIYGYQVPSSEAEVVLLNCGGMNRRMAVAAAQGALCMEQDWNVSGAEKLVLTVTGERIHLSVFEADNGWKGETPFLSAEDCLREANEEFEAYVQGCPACPARLESLRRMAAYVNWSCEIPARGQLRRPGVLMSKNWMCSVWSWDHCFNAMALSFGDPQSAWDQFMIPFDHQEKNGALPDCVNDTHLIRVFCKPPVHGWALRYMMRNMTLTPDQMQEAYEKLSRWTNWWLNFRDLDKDGLCEYYHGNDSGWDNSTLFRNGPAIESPDLAAFLVIQMDVLAELAEKLDQPETAQNWKARAEEMLRRMEKELFDHGHPVARDAFTHRRIEAESLMQYLPIILGERIPAGIRDGLIGALKESGCLTEYGFATEPPASPLFNRDGYWRGPIWAPSSLILIDGLYRAGEKALALQAAEGFCRLAAVGGFAENYDPISGEGLCDSAYTWSSSAFLIIAHEFVK